MHAVPRVASAWQSEPAASVERRSPETAGGRSARAIAGLRGRVGRCSCSVIARLVRAADFERVLRTRSRASSAHFAVHHVPDRPSVPAKPGPKLTSGRLSTGDQPMAIQAVDDSTVLAPATAPEAVWLGTVVPKRHAKRSVTRTLLKRQIRSAVIGRADVLAHGLWVVRLRAPFDRAHFVSAASDELRRAARAELEQLLVSAAQRVAGR